MQEGVVLEHTNTNCHMCTLLVNVLIIVYHRHTPHKTIERTRAKMIVKHLNAQCHEVTLMMTLLIINVT